MQVVLTQTGPLLAVEIRGAPEELILAAELAVIDPSVRGSRFRQLLKKHLAPILYQLYAAPTIRVEPEGRNHRKVVHLEGR